MNNKNINEEIEILDGLDDFFSTNNNKEDKAKEVEIFEPIKEDVKKANIFELYIRYLGDVVSGDISL